jgi:hypothetical protein
VVTLSLRPTDVHAIVFWSKNYAPFLRYLDDLDAHGLDCYFHYAITGYSADPATRPLETRVPHPNHTLDSFARLVEHYRQPLVVQWRYDPIIFTARTDATWHRQTFQYLAQRLAGWTQRCYISFLDSYGKVRRNVATLPAELQPYDPPASEKCALANDLAALAAPYDITLYTCAEDFAVTDHIHRGACVDADLIQTLWPHKRPSRAHCANRGKCGCVAHRDIGAYDTCPHGCIYCYAVQNRDLALTRYRHHDPHHTALAARTSTTPAAPSEPSDDAGTQLLLF